MQLVKNLMTYIASLKRECTFFVVYPYIQKSIQYLAKIIITVIFN